MENNRAEWFSPGRLGKRGTGSEQLTRMNKMRGMITHPFSHSCGPQSQALSTKEVTWRTACQEPPPWIHGTIKHWRCKHCYQSGCALEWALAGRVSQVVWSAAPWSRDRAPGQTGESPVMLSSLEHSQHHLIQEEGSSGRNKGPKTSQNVRDHKARKETQMPQAYKKCSMQINFLVSSHVSPIRKTIQKEIN
jgi:hypothetical protein